VQSAGSTFAFHCVEIADGSRSIAVGAEVEFDVVLRLGRPEAVHLRSVRRDRLTTADVD
jgi:CspA family cold shock protein